MKDNQRSFTEKVTSDMREYVQSLLDENRRLSTTVAELEAERDRSLEAQTVLIERLSHIEEESRAFAARYVEVEQQNTNLANLYVASYQLHGTLDRERVLAAIKEIVINLIGSEELAVWELDRDYDGLVLIDSFGIDASRWAALPLDSPNIVSKVAASGETYVAGPSTHYDKNLIACIPLKLDEKVIGVIGIFSLLPQKNGLEAVDFELFDLLATHGATALQCTRLAMPETVQ
jgi:regulator of replication initiation timing